MPYLITSNEAFEVGLEDAHTFLQIRPYCNGHNSIKEIVLKSNVSSQKIQSIINSLYDIGLGYPLTHSLESEGQIHTKFVNLCKIWADELKSNFIGNKFAEGKLPKKALIRWLIEMYHHITDFPNAIEEAAKNAQGELKVLLTKYAKEKRDNSLYILQTLNNLGVEEDQIKASSPLASTRLVGFIIRELFRLSPSAVFLVAALFVIKTEEFESQVRNFNKKMKTHYNISEKVFEPFFKHQAMDAKRGQADLLKNNLHLLKLANKEVRNLIVNNLYDLKCAFELMGTEIEVYSKNNQIFNKKP